MTNEPVREPADGDPKRMLSRARWEAEWRLMANAFPEFTPYCENGLVGFRGKLRGPKTGRIYAIAVQARVTDYPRYPPDVFIKPRPEPHHYQWPDGHLDICSTWIPARNTLMSRLLIAMKYVTKFDGSEEGGHTHDH